MSRSRPVPTTLGVHLATPADAPRVHALLAAAGDALAAEGFTNWIPAYPLERVEQDVIERAVYLVTASAAGVPTTDIGTFMLGPEPHRPYEPVIPWAEPGAPALYLNRMAIAPAWHGRGLGSWCLAEIARLAHEAGARAVRCDVYEPNLRTRAFYERAGFVARGTRSYTERTFVSYELILSS